jgi:hypothetical protein
LEEGNFAVVEHNKQPLVVVGLVELEFEAVGQFVE